MITGTSNFDEAPEVPCSICGGYYKADEPEQHECELPEIECDICGFQSTDPDGAHYCCEGNSND